MAHQHPKEPMSAGKRLDENTVLWGFLSGVVLGVIVWLWRVPRSGAATRAQISSTGQQLREKIAPTDTIAESLAEGKGIAHRHKEQHSRDS